MRELTDEQKKIGKELLRRLAEANKRCKEIKKVRPEPRYDEVYFEGVKWLDENG